MLLIPSSTREADALQAAARRSRVRRLARGVYTDDLDSPAAAIVQRDLLALLGALYPDCYLSHSTAALLHAYEGHAFVSGASTRRRLKLPGVTVHRLGSMPAPETRILELDTLVATALSGDPRPARVLVSTPLQTVFELLSRDARQPHRTLPEENIRGLIEGLSSSDRLRARRFAARNEMSTEYEKFETLARDLAAARAVSTARPGGLDLCFYDWRVGRLEELSGGEYRFTYDEEWKTPLTTHLPLRDDAPAYEGPGLPPFLDNLLPEGWAESRLRAVHHIARNDAFGLLKTTPKYLSNLTMRADDFDAGALRYDRLDVRLRDIAPDPVERLPVQETIGEAPDARSLWLELKRRGATRLSGVQRKLPVRLERAGFGRDRCSLTLAGVSRSGSHILKFMAPDDPGLVQNEWATMELARRVALTVAAVRQVSFQPDSAFPTPGLLVERFDVPEEREPAQIVLLEDAASLLGLRREDKYRTSMERIQDAIAEAGADRSQLLEFVALAAFSWLVGNGDLHAKNVSILRAYRPGTLGAGPEPTGVRLSPAYDLVNTAVLIPGDLFAVPVNGRENNLRRRDFHALATRPGLAAAEVDARIDEVVRGLRVHLDPVLAASGLPDDAMDAYREVVNSRISNL
jgi:serine/threonine-protein kinase HipA